MIKIQQQILKGSAKKVNLTASILRGQTLRNAIVQLEFCRKIICNDFYNIILSYIYKLKSNNKLEIEKLYVKEIKVYKSFSLKRFAARAKGRINQTVKPHSKIFIVLEYRC